MMVCDDFWQILLFDENDIVGKFLVITLNGYQNDSKTIWNFNGHDAS